MNRPFGDRLALRTSAGATTIASGLPRPISHVQMSQPVGPLVGGERQPAVARPVCRDLRKRRLQDQGLAPRRGDGLAKQVRGPRPEGGEDDLVAGGRTDRVEVGRRIEGQPRRRAAGHVEQPDILVARRAIDVDHVVDHSRAVVQKAQAVVLADLRQRGAKTLAGPVEPDELPPRVRLLVDEGAAARRGKYLIADGAEADVVGDDRGRSRQPERARRQRAARPGRRRAERADSPAPCTRRSHSPARSRASRSTRAR